MKQSVRDVLKLKKESYQAWLTFGTPETASRYRKAKYVTAWAVAKKKALACEELERPTERLSADLQVDLANCLVPPEGEAVLY